jgi:hypothetical protein
MCVFYNLDTSSANTAARRVKNSKLKGNETHTTHDNRSRAAGEVLIACFVSQGNKRHPVYRKPKSNKKLDIEITSAIYGIAGNPKKQMDVSKTKTIAENGLVSFYE